MARIRRGMAAGLPAGDESSHGRGEKELPAQTLSTPAGKAASELPARLSVSDHPLTACLRVALQPTVDPTPISPAQLSRFRGLYAAREALSEAHDILIQAKALVLCGLPYKRVASRSISRRARVGARSSLTVTFTAVDPTQPLPFGADRALLGWIQTLAYQSPQIRFSSLTEFFRAFGLSDSGREYRRRVGIIRAIQDWWASRLEGRIGLPLRCCGIA